MRKSNPALIPRNHRIEAALEAAVKQGDLSVMERLLDVLAPEEEGIRSEYKERTDAV